jgi:high affinity Mn2+ porin
MGTLRDSRRSITSVASWLAATAMLLSGCVSRPFLSPNESSTCPSNQTSTAEGKSDTQSNSKEGTEKNGKKSSPRTLGQAMVAYLHCLPTHGAGLKDQKEEEEEKNSGKTEKDDKKSKEEAGNSESNDKKEKAKINSGDERSDEDESKNDQESMDHGSGDEKKNGNNSSDEKKNGKEEETKESWISAHAQATMVTQLNNPFPSPYIGPLSFMPVQRAAISVTSTVFLDGRLWETDQTGGWSGELVFNPELAGGVGLSQSQGIAGFPNGEITRVGILNPTPYFARLYLRQTWGFGGEQETVGDEANQIAGKRDIDRFTLSVGKFSVTDFVDDNRYSHDPRTQFLPWSLVYNGAWDYPANVRGYTYGIALDFNQKYWAFRYAIVAEPTFANGAQLDPKFLKANGQVLEWAGRYNINDNPGEVRLLAYGNRAHMGDYLESLQQMPVDPDVTLTREYRWKYGFGLSWDQEITKELGIFARLGWNDGHTESWAFTAIDRLAEMGLLLKGKRWCRPNDVVGLAGCINGISGDHRNYLGAGGLDFIIGDGKLNYGPEEIFEFFYNYQLAKGLFAAFDFQEVIHPAYNRDRGPVSLYTLRVHMEF